MLSREERKRWCATFAKKHEVMSFRQDQALARPLPGKTKRWVLRWVKRQVATRSAYATPLGVALDLSRHSRSLDKCNRATHSY